MRRPATVKGRFRLVAFFTSMGLVLGAGMGWIMDLVLPFAAIAGVVGLLIGLDLLRKPDDRWPGIPGA